VTSRYLQVKPLRGRDVERVYNPPNLGRHRTLVRPAGSGAIFAEGSELRQAGLGESSYPSTPANARNTKTSATPTFALGFHCECPDR